jgi:hypothetical protein
LSVIGCQFRLQDRPFQCDPAFEADELGYRTDN